MTKRKTYLSLLLFIAIPLAALFAYKAYASTAVTWNGASYTIPTVGEENWFGDDKVDGLLVDLATDGFQKTGGAFNLTGEVDFGTTTGLLGLYFGSTNASPATSGIFRMSNAEGIGWRNSANTANLLLSVNSSNDLTYNGVSLISSSGLVPVSSGGTGLSSYAIGDLVYATPNSQTLTKLPIGTTDYLLKSNGTVPGWGQVVNASIDSSAAIARSKLASGTADHVVINSGAGAFSSEAALAVSRGGTNISSYSVGDLIYATPNSSTLTKLPIGSTGNILKVAGGVPTWGSAATTSAITALKTGDYSITASDDVVLVSPTAGLVILSLPSASANAGKVYHIARPALGTQLARVSPASGDTINGATTFLMATQNDNASMVSDGTSIWQVYNNNVTVAAFAESNTARGIDNASAVTADFLMEDEIYDTHDAYSTTTGIFTVPAGLGGKYRVSASSTSANTASWSSAESWNMQIWKNGGAVRSITRWYAINGITAGIASAVGSTTLSLVPGDTLEVRILQDSGDNPLNTDGSASNNWVSYERIGN